MWLYIFNQPNPPLMGSTNRFLLYNSPLFGFLFGNLRALGHAAHWAYRRRWRRHQWICFHRHGCWYCECYRRLCKRYGMAAIFRVYSLWICFYGDFSFEQTLGTYDLKIAVIYIFNEFYQAFKIDFLIVKL